MPHNLRRVVGRGDLHFITFTCYQRRKFLDSARNRNLAVQILGEVRARFKCKLVGYVVMPDHVHLLISEPPGSTPAKAMQVFKQRVSRKLRGKKKNAARQLRLAFSEEASLPRRFWQRRYFDLNIYSSYKLREKLNYIHENPVKEELVSHPKTGRGAVGRLMSANRRYCPLILWTCLVRRAKEGEAHPLHEPKPQRVGHPVATFLRFFADSDRERHRDRVHPRKKMRDAH